MFAFYGYRFCLVDGDDLMFCDIVFRACSNSEDIIMCHVCLYLCFGLWICVLRSLGLEINQLVRRATHMSSMDFLPFCTMRFSNRGMFVSRV